jgi:hypothetical protein
MERNEDLQTTFPPFHFSSEVNIVYLHHQTDLSVIEQLIEKAKKTTLFTIDTESEGRKESEKGALIQIQCVHSRQQSTMILIETRYLSDRQSSSFMRMKELCSIILKDENKILSWGEIDMELEKFQEYQLLTTTTPKGGKNMQQAFGRWHNQLGIHVQPKRPTTEEDEPINIWDTILGLNSPEEASTRTICDCGHRSHQDAQATWSLQDAIALVFGEFLDKSETINKWGCGLDPKLNTWQRKVFSRRQYREEEERGKRQKMQDYAVNDCIAVTRLFFHPQRSNELPTFADRTSTGTMEDFDLFYGYSADEIRDIYLFQEQATAELGDLNSFDITVTDQPRVDDQPAPQESHEAPPQLIDRPSKTERQRKKNEKLRWKQKNRWDFQHKVCRPIYHRYDYRKIRSQLMDDHIHTSHELTINRKKSEVLIGFKSADERQRAIQTIRVNYFSREQFKRRWC